MGTGTKIKTGPGSFIKTTNYRDQDQSSGPKMSWTGTGPGTGLGPGPGPKTIYGWKEPNGKRRKELRLPVLHQQTETKIFVYKTNINKLKRTASFKNQQKQTDF